MAGTNTKVLKNFLVYPDDRSGLSLAATGIKDIMKSATATSICQWAMVIFFLLVILSSPVKMIFSPSVGWSDVEKRKLAEFPHYPVSGIQVSVYFKNLDIYLQDNFGFRDFYIYRYYREMKKHFGETGVKDKVLEGKDGWLYFAVQRQLRDFQGKEKLTKQRILDWITQHNSRRDWLAEQGIHYLLVIPPNKQAIYPEYLPDDLIKYRGVSQFQQILDHTKFETLPYLVNLHGPLLLGKMNHQLYHKNDTHWNTRGAYLAYQSIVESVQEIYPRTSMKSEFAFAPEKVTRCTDIPDLCDLAMMAMIQEKAVEFYPVLEEYVSCAEPVDFLRYNLSGILQKKGQTSFAKKCRIGKLKVVVFRDSFMEALEPYLSENFAEVVYLWKYYDQKIMEEILVNFKPDLVIEEIIERDLFNN